MAEDGTSGAPIRHLSSDAKLVHIAIALVWKEQELLVTRRMPGSHLAGYWEFPGGKLELGETPERCAEREVLEEVGVVCRAERRRNPLVHVYAERSVSLTPVDCAWIRGAPRLLGIAAWAWASPRDLAGYEFPPANAELIASLISEVDCYP